MQNGGYNRGARNVPDIKVKLYSLNIETPRTYKTLRGAFFWPWGNDASLFQAFIDHIHAPLTEKLSFCHGGLGGVAGVRFIKDDRVGIAFKFASSRHPCFPVGLFFPNRKGLEAWVQGLGSSSFAVRKIHNTSRAFLSLGGIGPFTYCVNLCIDFPESLI